jgi:hypothetical protein
MASFTTRGPGLQQNGPQVKLTIGLQPDAEQLLKDAGQPIPAAVELQAIIDTGSTFTVMAMGTGARLGLQPVGVAMISTASHANVPCEQFAVRVAFSNNVILNVVATEAPMPGQPIQALIGRDILSRGVLIYIGYVESFTLSF